MPMRFDKSCITMSSYGYTNDSNILSQAFTAYKVTKVTLK